MHTVPQALNSPRGIVLELITAVYSMDCAPGDGTHPCAVSCLTGNLERVREHAVKQPHNNRSSLAFQTPCWEEPAPGLDLSS